VKKRSQHVNKTLLTPGCAVDPKHDEFIRVSKSALKHYAVTSLPPAAFRVWIYLQLHANYETGDVDCAVSQAPNMSPNTFRAACKELEKRGFLKRLNPWVQDKHMTKTAQFQLTEKWNKK
jgi:hypothetical protein